MATEQQQGATEAYGTIPGKLLEGAAKLGFMSKEQGAESALWAGTGKTTGERREEVQGRYFSEADGKVSKLLFLDHPTFDEDFAVADLRAGRYRVEPS